MVYLIIYKCGHEYFHSMRTVSTSCIFSMLLSLILLPALTSCYSNRYFGTPDYFTRQPGTLILKTGEKISGEISVNNLLGNSVVIRPYRSKQNRVYKVEEVKLCRLDIGIFEPMLIGREIPAIRSLPVFMERLTPDSFSVHLYEAYQKVVNENRMGDVTLEGGVEYDLEYFVHLPNDDSSLVWELSTAVLTDHLRNGFDTLFNQCPGLRERIRSGDPAYDIYFTPQVQVSEHVVVGKLSTPAKKEKVQNIIRVFAEYEGCRRFREQVSEFFSNDIKKRINNQDFF